MRILIYVCGLAIGTFASAESQDIRQVGTFSYLRGQPSAAVLSDGRVLVTSGWSGSGLGGCPGRSLPIGTADLFDPATETLSEVSGMISPRWEHESILLDDGRVLIMGGATNCVFHMTNSSEIFDPVSNSFYSTGPMTISRRVFPVHKRANGNVVAFGGIREGSNGNTTDRVDEYDIATGTWSTIGYISQPKGRMASCDLGNDRILLVGGGARAGDREPSRNNGAEIFDLATNSSRVLSALTVFNRGNATSGLALDDGRCLFAGGTSSDGVEIFDPVTETFTAVAFPSGYTSQGAARMPLAKLNDGRVFIGFNFPMLFDPATNTLSLVQTSLALPQYDHMSSRTQTGAVFFGGGSVIQSAFLYSPNLPPTANAGPDQSIRAGELVILDGSGSFDDNTSAGDLVFEWEIRMSPAGSAATLANSDSAFPSFTADVAGTYLVELLVHDADGASSDPAYVEVSSDNLAPTAAMSVSSLVVVGDVVALDGSVSSDPEFDILSFQWSITSAPIGSTAAPASPFSQLTSFVPDVPGDYVVKLEVADLIGPGTPAMATVNAADPNVYVQIVLDETANTVEELPLSAFHGGGGGNGNGNGSGGGVRNAFLNFLQEANQAVQDGNETLAISILQEAISRTNGCANNGLPDGNGPGRDWITECDAQQLAFSALTEAVSVLQGA